MGNHLRRHSISLIAPYIKRTPIVNKPTYQRAFVFPFLAPGESPDPQQPSSFKDDNFFGTDNGFKSRCFKWHARKSCVIFNVTRNGDGVEITPGNNAIEQIGRLDWEAFSSLQSAFESWLVRHSGWPCWHAEKRFYNLDESLEQFWKSWVLEQSDFRYFSKRYVNPKQFEVHYLGTNANLANALLVAQAVEPYEELLITWGSTALFPYSDGINAGYSRPSVGGETRLTITPYSGGLHLLAPNAPPMLAENKPLGAQGLLPFDRRWSALFGKYFVPIYNPFDLWNKDLLRFQGDQNRSGPPFLFLLSPKRYAKADGNTQESVNQFTTDASLSDQDGAITALQLARRFILVGTETPFPDDVRKEWTRLLDAADDLSNSKGNRSGDYKGFTSGVFANQTFVAIGRRVKYNGCVLEAPQDNFKTYAAIVGSLNPTIFSAQSSANVRPSLEVLKLRCEPSGVPFQRMKLRFYATSQDILNMAQVSENDDFRIFP